MAGKRYFRSRMRRHDGTDCGVSDSFDSLISFKGSHFFVVGFTDNADADTLDAIARNGGTAFDTHLRALDRDALSAALDSIGDTVESCSFEIADPGPMGGRGGGECPRDLRLPGGYRGLREVWGHPSMDAINFSVQCWFGGCQGGGPWVQADLEGGLYPGGSQSWNPNQQSFAMPYVTAMEKNNGTTELSLKGGNAQSGGLATLYQGGLLGAGLPWPRPRWVSR